MVKSSGQLGVFSCVFLMNGFLVWIFLMAEVYEGVFIATEPDRVEPCSEWYLTFGVWLGMVTSSSHWGRSLGMEDGVTLLFLAFLG